MDQAPGFSLLHRGLSVWLRHCHTSVRLALWRAGAESEDVRVQKLGPVAGSRWPPLLPPGQRHPAPSWLVDEGWFCSCASQLFGSLYNLRADSPTSVVHSLPHVGGEGLVLLPACARPRLSLRGLCAPTAAAVGFLHLCAAAQGLPFRSSSASGR